MKRIDYSILLRDTLHIGSGKTLAGYPRTAAIQKVRGQPLIPGSTLRGKIRANFRALLPAVRETVNETVLSMISGHTDSQIVSDFFGAPNHSGRVIIMDAKIDANQGIDRVPGIRLESDTRSVAPGALFSYEVVPPGTCFSTSLFLISPPEMDADRANLDEVLLLLSVKQIENTGLGRQKTRVAIDLGLHEERLNQLTQELMSHE